MSHKDRYMGKSRQQRVSELAEKAIILYAGEVQRSTSKRLSFNDTLIALLEELRPDLVDDAERLLKEQ